MDFEVALYTIAQIIFINIQKVLQKCSSQWTSSRIHANVRRLEILSGRNYSTAKSASALTRTRVWRSLLVYDHS